MQDEWDQRQIAIGAGSVRVESVAASRLEHALSEVASSMGSVYQARGGGRQQTWTLQMQIWLLLGTLPTKQLSPYSLP